ncbi:MAG: hypothetical protein ACR2HH_08495 [Chthoniobacterales bacterium]
MSHLALLASLVGAAIPAQAILVQEVGITPYHVVNISVTGINTPSGTYTGPVLAGINQLLVDGLATNAFCIDPFHFSLSSSTGYSFTSLALAPKPPGTMGADKALLISRLWGMAYSPSMTASQAAGFQIALWEIVGGSNFSLLGFDYGAGALLTQVTTYTGPMAILTALTGPGQDYVIRDPNRQAAVPETGSTLALLAFGTTGLVVVRGRLKRGNA